MLKKSFILSILVTIISVINGIAQKNPVLFTVNGEKFYSSEFSKIYEKNLSLVNDPSQKDIDNYLNLFIHYKLKLQEAYLLKMDTIGSYRREYAKYENQLIQPYLKDKNLEIDLLNEAYLRSKKEVNASHILIKIEKGEDTLMAYQKIKAIRDRIINGEDFAKIAKENSNDPSASKNGGNLGYFTAFQMVYPFENVAYQTQVGEVSQPFKTQFGYHILKVLDTRDSKGEVEVAHIMIKGNEDKNKSLIDDLKTQLNNGANFTELAKNYSQDGGTSKNGGILPKFGSGRMIPSFETVAFSLTNEGDISEPFKTEYGWHIVKLIKKYPIGSFDDMKSMLKQKVDQGQRAELMGNSVVKRLLKEYQIIVNEEKLAEFSKPEWLQNITLQKNDVLLSIEGKKFTINEFFKYYQANNNLPLNQSFNKFKEEKVLEIYKAKLPDIHPELKETMKEYREGLLLFDLMQKRIWDKAEKDSIGLQNYFESHKDEFQWKERAKMTIATLKTQNGEAILNSLLQKIENDSIWNTNKDLGLIDIKDEEMETANENFPKDLKLEAGQHIILPLGINYKLYFIKEILPISHKSLNEVRGKVMSNYQDQIEKDWMMALKKQYTVKVNKKSLKNLKIKYNK